MSSSPADQASTEQPAMQLFESGMIFEERFEIVSLVGEGGMGRVYQARDIQLDRHVALKLLHTDLLGDHEDMVRFKTEGRILSQLDSQNIVKLYRFGVTSSKVPYLVMEYLEGKSLRQLLKTSNALAPGRALTIAVDICSALKATHDLGIVHRDLKPTNIMLVQDEGKEVVKVLDFGLSRVLQSSSVSVTQHLTKTGLLIGSVQYMSPEQCLGQKVDQRADIYALGCLIFEMLTGQQPFYADNPIGMLHKHLHEQAKPLKSFATVGVIPPGLEEVLRHAMQKDPKVRYQTIQEFKDDLTLILNGEKPALRTTPERTARRTASQRIMLEPAKMRESALMLLTFVALVLLFNWLDRPTLTAPGAKADLNSSVADSFTGSITHLRFDETGKLSEIQLSSPDKGEQLVTLPVAVKLTATQTPLPGSECTCSIEKGTVVALKCTGNGAYSAPYRLLKDFLLALAMKEWKKANQFLSDTGAGEVRRRYPSDFLERYWRGLPNLSSSDQLDRALQGHCKIRKEGYVVVIHIDPQVLLPNHDDFISVTMFDRAWQGKSNWGITLIKTDVPKAEWDQL